MGDSTTMTIDFLRARLLSERSVSRTARQRADQFAKRVVELEERLRIVTIQRKKAEKAAAEVLAILETQGIGDFSEAVDSSSEQDVVPSELQGGDDTVKEDGSSTTSRMDRSEVDDGYSGSDHEVSPSQGRSLSWKGNNKSPESLEKKKVYQTRQRQRRNVFMDTAESSPKNHFGKSCRKLKRKEMGCAAEDGKGSTTFHGFQGKETDAQAESIPSGYLGGHLAHSNVALRTEENKLESPVSCSSEDQSKLMNNDCYPDGVDKDEDMEQALEKQAQLIGQYQAEENAQRAWEEKFNETNCSTMGSSEAGKMPDGVADMNALKEKPASIPGNIVSQDKGNSVEVPVTGMLNAVTAADQTFDSTISERNGCRNVEMALTVRHGFTAPSAITSCNTGTLDADADVMDQKCNSTTMNESETGSQDFEFPGQAILCMREDEDQVHQFLDGNTDIISHSSSNLQPPSNRSLERRSTGSPSAQSSCMIIKEKQSDVQNQLHLSLPRACNSHLGGVLEALQRAKLSLKQEISRLPQPSQTTWATAESQVLTVKSSEILDIPVGSAGLFRLPTDEFPQADLSSHNNYSSATSLARPQSAYAFSTFGSSSQYPMASYTESGPRITAKGRPDFDSRLGTGLGSPTYTSMHSYPLRDFATARTTVNSGFQRPYVDMKSEMLPRDRYSFYGIGRSGSDRRGF